jgi:hypothetical protein
MQEDSHTWQARKGFPFAGWPVRRFPLPRGEANAGEPSPFWSWF